MFIQQRRLCLENYDCKGTLETDTYIFNWWLDSIRDLDYPEIIKNNWVKKNTYFFQTNQRAKYDIHT